MRVIAVLALLVAVAPACAGAGARSGGTISVNLEEFAVEPDPTSAPAGRVRFEATNGGSVTHELVVLRTRRAAGGLRVSKGEVDVDAPGITKVGAVLNIDAGESRPLTLRLTRGRYVLICNIPGHYTSGMHAPFRMR